MFATIASISGGWLLAISLGNVAAAGAICWYAWKTHRARTIPGPGVRSSVPQLPTPRPAQTAEPTPAFAPTPPVEPAGPTQLDPEQAQQLLQRLTELAANTAQEVGEHATRVQNVTAQISALSASGGGPSQTLLLTAARQILEANQQLQTELTETKAELHEHTKRIEVYMAEARTDALVGVPNRRALDEELGRRYAAWQRQGTPLSLFLLDVDHFKKFNDQHGHQAGDEVLRNLGLVLAKNVRDMDFVARYGGEEFAFVLPGTRLEQGKLAAERIRNAVARATVPIVGEELQVTVSVGLAELRSGDTLDSFLQRADMALYAAKENGRNCSYYHDGTVCLPVDLATIAARAEVAKVIREELVDVAPNDWSTDRRGQRRHKFDRIQRIAPYVAGRLPSLDEFHEVHCRDLNSGGLSFWLPRPPQFSLCIVALGPEQHTAKYLVAEVLHSVPVRHDDKTVYLIGCRFTERVDLEERGGGTR